MKQEKSDSFNIYYLNFTKVYEIAMMINNLVLTKIENDKIKTSKKEYMLTSSISAKNTQNFLSEIKGSISADAKETSFLSSKIVETLDVKTTKSILLRNVIKQCDEVSNLTSSSEGDLVKINNIKLELLDEENLRQFLILRKDAFKGFKLEGIEINNIVSSMLQDYAYILKGTITGGDFKANDSEIIIKIPLEIQTEFENKYSINDLLIGHVSIIGIYKGLSKKELIFFNTFTFLEEIKRKQNIESNSKVIKSTGSKTSNINSSTEDSKDYHFIDILAVIQDVSFKFELQNSLKSSLWEKIKFFVSTLLRKH